VESFNWDQKHAGVQLLMAELTNEPKYIADISTFCDYNMPHGGAKYTPGGLLFIEKWGVLRHSLNIAYICLRAGTLMGMDAIRQSNYRKFAMSQVNSTTTKEVSRLIAKLHCILVYRGGFDCRLQMQKSRLFSVS
jgi:hypothetical protein